LEINAGFGLEKLLRKWNPEDHTRLGQSVRLENDVRRIRHLYVTNLENNLGNYLGKAGEFLSLKRGIFMTVLIFNTLKILF